MSSGKSWSGKFSGGLPSTGGFVSIEPNPAYIPIFAAVLMRQKLGCRVLKPTPTPDTLLLLPSGIRVSGVESWVQKLADAA